MSFVNVWNVGETLSKWTSYEWIMKPWT